MTIFRSSMETDFLGLFRWTVLTPQVRRAANLHGNNITICCDAVPAK
jgi:hypothetical protein